jgi:hypothetical protein
MADEWEGEIVTYWFDDGGVLVSLSKSVVRTVENISDNVKLVKSITDNRPFPLFDLSGRFTLAL